MRVEEETKRCPDCAEDVKAAARVCRFCGYRFDEPDLGTRPATPEAERRAQPESALEPSTAADPPRALDRLARLAIAGLIVAILIELLNLAADGNYLSIVQRLLDGEGVSPMEIDDADRLVLVAGIAIATAYLLVGPLTILPWFFRAYRNLGRRGTVSLRYKPGWAVGAWFVPILQLWRPKQIANDIWRASPADAEISSEAWHSRPVAAIVHWWWGLLLTAGFLGNVAARVILSNDEPLLTRGDVTDALERERSGYSIDAFSSLLAIAAAILLIIVIRRITRAQTEASTRPQPAPPTSPPSRETRRRRVGGARVALAVAAVAVLAGSAVAVALNWAPEERLGEVTAPRFDPGLAGGGLSNRELGEEALVSSLENLEPIGYQILADALEEDAISEFAQVEAKPPWTSEFRIDDGRLRMRFRGDRSFILNYPPGDEAAEEMFGIGRRYAFFSDQEQDALSSLENRTEVLAEVFDARPLTVGVSEPDLVAEAAPLAADWENWNRDYGEHPETAELAESQRKVALVIEEVSRDPTNPGLRDYERAIRRWNQAIRAYNASL